MIPTLPKCSPSDVTIKLSPEATAAWEGDRGDEEKRLLRAVLKGEARVMSRQAQRPVEIIANEGYVLDWINAEEDN